MVIRHSGSKRSRGVYRHYIAPAISGRGPYRVRRKRSTPMYRRVSGRGPYKFSAPDTGKKIFGTIGDAVGNATGLGFLGDIGRGIGGGLGTLFKTITGFGEYQVKSNSLVPGLAVQKAIPQFEGANSIRVKHKEYVGDLTSATSFTNDSYGINPGNQRLFPWLSTLAQNYEQYSIQGMILYFRSTSADALNSTNTALGKIIIACDYNAGDDDYINAEQMYSSMHANSGPPSKDIPFAVECSRANAVTNSLYIRTGGVPDDHDIRLYDHGKVQVAVDGCQAASVVGEIWVSYDIVLFNPVQNATVGLNIKSAKSQLTLPVVVAGNHHFGTSSTFEHNHIDGLVLSDNQITFPPRLSAGTFLILYQIIGDSTACTAPTWTCTNCTALYAWTNNLSPNFSNNSNTVDKYHQCIMVRLTDPNAKVVATIGTIPANVTSGDLFIVQMNNADGSSTSGGAGGT